MTPLDFLVLVWTIAAILAGVWALDAQLMTLWDMLIDVLKVYARR